MSAAEQPPDHLPALSCAECGQRGVVYSVARDEIVHLGGFQHQRRITTPPGRRCANCVGIYLGILPPLPVPCANPLWVGPSVAWATLCTLARGHAGPCEHHKALRPQSATPT